MQPATVSMSACQRHYIVFQRITDPRCALSTITVLCGTDLVHMAVRAKRQLLCCTMHTDRSIALQPPAMLFFLGQVGVNWHGDMSTGQKHCCVLYPYETINFGSFVSHASRW